MISNLIDATQVISMTHRRFTPIIVIQLIGLILLYSNSTQASHDSSQLNNEQQLPVRSHHNVSCNKNWELYGNKCLKFPYTKGNYEIVKNKCVEMNAQLVKVDDESAKERENSGSSDDVNIINYLMSDQAKPDIKSRPFYVNISSDLLRQYRDEQLGRSGEDSYNLMSKLWLPRDDPQFVNVTLMNRDLSGNQTRFVLAFSNTHRRWGLLPVNHTKRFAYICEKVALDVHPPQELNAEATNARNQADNSRGFHEFNQSRGNHEANQSSSSSANSADARKPQNKETANPTPQPDSANMLFRESPQDQSIVLGSTAEMRCSPLDNDSTVHWTFNGKNLIQSNRLKSYPNGNLKIEHVRQTDDGNYTCTIHSAGVTESKSARLEIVERPHQPEYISAELLDKLSTSVSIKWTPGFNGNSPIKKYLVEMRTVSNDNIDNEIQTLMQSNLWEVAKANISADQTSVIIPDLKPAKKYIFRVKASNRVGTGEPSWPTRTPIEVPVQPPSMAPENLSGTPKSSTSIAIQWQPPPVDSQNGLIKGYKIRHKLAGYASDSDWYTQDVQEPTHLNFLLEDLIVWQKYEIQVAAENDKGVGPFSASIIVHTKEGRPDKGPRNVSAEAVSSTAIKVNWNPPPPQHINGLNRGYKVQLWTDMQLKQSARELTVPHNTASPLHSTTIDTLSPYTYYYLTVKCYTDAGEGPANDDIVEVKTKQDLPEVVASLEFADVLDKTLRVVWEPPKRVNGELDHYTLDYFESASPEKRISRRIPAGTSELRIVDLTPQTSYVFRLVAYTKVGAGPAKTAQIETSIPPVYPEPPSHLVHSEVGANSVRIRFNPGFNGNANIDKWVAEALTPMARMEHSSRWQTVYVSTNHSQDNSVVVRNLRPFTRYRIRLTPVNVVGPSRYASEPSDEFQTAQLAPEQAPNDFGIEDVRSNSLSVHWTPLSNNLWSGIPRGYNITWTETNNSTTQHHLVSESRADSQVIKDLEEFTEYLFHIYAVNDAGSSQPSEPILVTTLEDVPSAGPANLTAHALSSNAVSVDWSSVPKRHRNGLIRGYKIQYQALKPNAPLQHKTVEDNSTKHVTLNDLKAFTSYHLAVAAFTSIGDGVYSPVLTVQTLEDAPGTPQNLSAPAVSQTSARILWDPPEDPNGEILGYRVSYQTLPEGKEVANHELQQTDRTFKASNLKPDTHYVFTVTAKTKEGWGQQATMVLYTYDSQLRANLPFYRESWFVILCACLSIVITIIVTASLFIQTKSYKYKQHVIESTSHDRLGDAGFSIDDDPPNHYNNGFGLLSSHNAHHRRSNGAISQSTANFTLPKSPPRPHPGSVVYSDEGDDDVFEDNIEKPMKGTAGTSNYDSSGDSLTEKPSEISSSTAPESESADDEYVNMANKHFVNHYANVNGTLRSQKAWKKSSKQYSSHRTAKPRLPQRPVPSVPQVPGEPSTSSSDTTTQPVAGSSGMQQQPRLNGSNYSDSGSGSNLNHQPNARLAPSTSQTVNNTDEKNSDKQNTQQADLLNSHIVNLNGGRIIVDNMAGSRAPLPGFTSFV